MNLLYEICEPIKIIRSRGSVKNSDGLMPLKEKQTGDYKVKRGSFEPLIGGRSTRRIWDSAMCVIYFLCVQKSCHISSNILLPIGDLILHELWKLQFL